MLLTILVCWIIHVSVCMSVEQNLSSKIQSRLTNVQKIG